MLNEHITQECGSIKLPHTSFNKGYYQRVTCVSVYTNAKETKPKND